MINYERCSEQNLDLAYEAFMIGFSDYIIKFNITKEDFIKRFFGAEGNSMEYSFMAVEDNKGIGLILGGIKEYEGIKTMRCGTLAVDPDYRGSGVSSKLFELHREEAIKNNCKQLFLEVIVGNERAISFYKRQGYEKVYDLAYFSLNDLSKLKESPALEVQVEPISYQGYEYLVNSMKYFHINWQNDLEYVSKSQDSVYYGAYCGEKLVGCGCFNASGKISCLLVDKNYRNRGAAASMLSEVCKELKNQRFTVAFPNNSLLEGFLKHMGFKRDAIAQYEMYMTL